MSLVPAALAEASPNQRKGTMNIPLNRVVAFAGPYISAISGALAAWLVAKLNVLGIPGLDQANLATHLAAGGTALLTAGLVWLGHSSWLKGHHIELTYGTVGDGIDMVPDEEHPAVLSLPVSDPASIPADEGDVGAAA